MEHHDGGSSGSPQLPPDSADTDQAVLKWPFVLCAAIVGTILVFNDERRLSISAGGLAAILGFSLPSFAVGMLCSRISKGRAGILIGIVGALAISWSQWFGGQNP
jgi:hypothetical protein